MDKDITFKDLNNIGDTYSKMLNESFNNYIMDNIKQSIIKSITNNHLSRIMSFAPKSISLARYALHNSIINESEQFTNMCDSDKLTTICESIEKMFEDVAIPKELSSKLPPDEEKRRFKTLSHHSNKKYGILFLSVGFSIKGKLMETPQVLYKKPDAEIDIDSMDEVLMRINEMCDFYFEPSDYYCDFSNISDSSQFPKLMATKVLTSDAIQGSDTLAKYFGPKGKFADYLYKADGTARLEPYKIETDDMSIEQRDVNVVKSFPVFHVCANVVSKTGDGNVKPLVPSDFEGTKISVIE
jgi:hypothetical protein